MNVEMGFERPPKIDLPFGIGHSWENETGGRGGIRRLKRNGAASNTSAVQ
jgi:hypothetical protein